MSRKAALVVVGFVAFLYLLSVVVVGLGRWMGVVEATPVTPSSPVLLVSIDGSRHNYLGRFPAPTLERLAVEGAHAERLIPAYPSVTFPNHTTLVTGLRPGHHGIVGNAFWDPERGVLFSASDPTQQADPHWWRGEPIWTTVDLVVVSDHGMAEMAADRVVYVDERVGDWPPLEADLEHVLWDELVQVWPRVGREVAVLAALQAADLGPVQVVRREEAPEALHVRGADRVAPILLVSAEGWSATTRTESTRHGPRPSSWGSHGFDPRTPSTGGLLLARGPSFRQGATVGPVENVHVYALMAQALGIRPARHDGDLDVVRGFLRQP